MNKIHNSNLKFDKANKDIMYFDDKGQLKSITRKELFYKGENVGEAIDTLLHIKKALNIKSNEFLKDSVIYLVLNDKKFLNVLYNEDNTIKSLDEINKLIPNQEIPLDLDNDCYYLDENDVITLNKEKLNAQSEVF